MRCSEWVMRKVGVGGPGQCKPNGTLVVIAHGSERGSWNLSVKPGEEIIVCGRHVGGREVVRQLLGAAWL